MSAPRGASRAPREWRTHNVVGVSLASLLSDAGHEMITALLPGFLLTLGAPPIGLGLIEGVSSFTFSVGEIWGGDRADALRDRAPLVYAGYALTALKALIAIVPTWPWIILIRTVAWVGRGWRGPLRDAMIADEVPEEVRGKAYGFREALDTTGAALGPLLAALLVGQLHYRLLIGLSVVPAILTIIVVIALVHEIPHRLTQPLSTASLFEARYPGPFVRYAVGAGIFAIGYVAPTFFILRATRILETHGSAFLVASGFAIGLYTVHNICYALASFPSGSLADRLPPKRLLGVGYLAWTAVLLAFAAGPSQIYLLGILFVVSGTATGLIEPVQTTWSAQLLPVAVRGRGLGLFSGIGGFGNLVSGIVFGLIWTGSAAGPAFVAAAVMALAGAVIVSTVPVGARE